MRVVLMGAGHIGQTIASLLSNCGDYQVKVVDRSADALAKLAHLPIKTAQVDTTDAAALRAELKGFDAVINAFNLFVLLVVANDHAAVPEVIGERI